MTAIRRWLRSDMLVLRWVFLALYVAVVAGFLLLAIQERETALFILLGVFVAAQALFIFGSGTIHLCRPIKRRRLVLPVIAAASMMTLLAAGFLAAMTELIFGGGGPDWLAVVFWICVAGNWIGWGVLIYFRTRDVPRFGAIGRMARYLFAGSLAELIATVPAHVIVSRRPGCLVGLLTMFGIVAGVSVMLFSFGPAILLLFLRPRYRAEQGDDGHPYCPACGYDLRASSERCPECGLPMAPRNEHRSGPT